jgi:hypothetical protein
MTDKSLDKTIFSLAFMKINWERRKWDYLDNYLPFLATLIVKKGYKSIEEKAEQINQLLNDFTQEFGLVVPYHPMITILNRARKRGLIERREYKFIPTDEVYKYDFSSKTQTQERKYEELINSFINFSSEKYSQELNREEAEEILIGFLRQRDLDMLFAAYSKSILPEVRPSQSRMFLFCKFIENIHSQNSELFQTLLDVVIGHILANIVLYEDEADRFYYTKLENLNLYLDTGLILRLLEVEGPIIQSFYSEFLTQSRGQGVNFFIFQHTYDEIMGILQNALSWIESSDYEPSKASPVLRYFRGEGYKGSDILMFINRVDKTLDAYKIKRVDTPDPNVYGRYQIDEEKLQQFIVDTYQRYNPDFEIQEKGFTVQKDIQSISAVNKLREGRKPQNIKQAEQIFITTNSALAYANKIFEKEECGEGFYMPACITDTLIGTLIWLRNPQKVEINEKKIIAEVYAALQPSETLLKQYLTEVERLRRDRRISEDEYILLRDSLIVRTELAEETLGDPSRFVATTPLELLEKIKKEAYERWEQEKKEHEKTKQELEKGKTEKIEKQAEYEKKAEKWAKIFSIMFVLIALAVFSILQRFELPLIPKLVISGMLFIIGLLGLTVKVIRQWMKNFILDKIFGLK